MYLPQFSGIKRKAQRQVVEFGGLNYTQNIRDGELASARGVSDRMWPALTTRVGRVLAGSSGPVSDLFAWDKLVTVEGSDLCYGGEVVGTVTPGKKQFAVVNTKLCIFPDKKYFDLETGTVEGLGAKIVNAEGIQVKFEGETVTVPKDMVLGAQEMPVENRQRQPWFVEANGSTESGGVYSYRIKCYDALEWDAEEKRWNKEGEAEHDLMRTSHSAYLFKGKTVILTDEKTLNLKRMEEIGKVGSNGLAVYKPVMVEDFAADNEKGLYGVITEVDFERTEISGGPDSIETVTLTVEIHDASTGNGDVAGLFRTGDRVNITGCVKAEGNNREALEIKEVGDHVITFSLGDGQQFAEAVETGTVTVERVIPDMDFICESNNRLFGCSSKENTVYASALGDPTNWFTYAGLASDSYAVAVGSPGAFTGCCAYGSGVLFWKENALHKLMGLYPEEYEVISYQFVGVQAGCERSVQNINEVLYYKGRDGVYSYTGGYPQKISGKLGLVDYDGAVAGSDGRNYIISMRRVDTGAWETLCYGVETGLWMGEESRKVEALASLDGTLYFLADEKLYRREGEDDRPEGENGQETGIPWEAVFVPVNETVHNKKGYSRLLLRLELDQGAWAEVDVSIDSGPWKTVWTAQAGDSQSVVIPVRPGRCDRFQARLRGEGRFVLRSMVREFTVGSVM